MKDLDALLGEIETTTSLLTLWALMLRYYREQGFGAIAYVLFDKGRMDQANALLESGFPSQVVTRFVELGYGRHAPLIRVAMATGRPHLANDVAARHRLSRSEKTHREAIVQAGLGEALALPLYGPLGRDAVAILAQARDPERFDRALWPLLHMIAQRAHLRAFSLSGQEPPPQSLSEREVEILRFVAQGKSNGVIADILSIAAGTVDTYLRRIFEKLDVADRTSAAVKGVSMGLIRA